ncbi:MAG: dihydrolipoamide acetyltransferase [Myxococcota bacterium]|nr:dihydrolipoamide acetyltransferase [Myxococcota bacterium]
MGTIRTKILFIGASLLVVAGSVNAYAQEAGSAKTEAAAPSQAPSQSEDDAVIRMRGLEERVNSLKEKIFRSKARLMLLRETVLNGALAGAKAKIVHRNEMGTGFVLESVSYALDGAPIFTKTDTDGDLNDVAEIELFNGSIVPGNHNLSVNMVYRGSGYGVFSYVKGYSFKIRSSYAFTAEEGKVTSVRIVGYEKGGITTDLKDRPAVRYDVEVKRDPNQPNASGASQKSE